MKVSFQGYNQPWHRPRGSRKGFARKAMKTRFLIRSVIAVLALPVMVAGVIPGWLLLTLRGAIGAGLPSPENLIVAATGDLRNTGFVPGGWRDPQVFD